MAGTVCILVRQVTEGLGKDRFKPWLVSQGFTKKSTIGSSWIISYLSVIAPQGGSRNVIFVGSGYLTQHELHRLGL